MEKPDKLKQIDEITAKLLEACKLQQKVIDRLLPCVRDMSKLDYELIGEATIKAHHAVKEAERR